MQIKQHLVKAADRLASAGIETASLDARLLLQHALQQSHEYILMHEAQPLAKDVAAIFSALLARREQHEPLAYIVGKQAFWKDAFHVSADVLIPRADSETLIEACLQLRPEKDAAYHILDLGTGSGCLALSLLREYKNAQAMAIDKSENALFMAKKNAKSLKLDSRVQFFHADMCDEKTLPVTPALFDIIIANPPYICSDEIKKLQKNVREFEPLCALDGGMQGLNFYFDVFKWLPKRMHALSLALFEVGHDQAMDVEALAKQNNYAYVKQFNDLAGIARVVACANRQDT